MPWLDREKTPFRFTVAASVTSGLIVAVLLNVARTGVSGGATLLWFSLTSVGVAAVSAVVWMAYRAHRGGRRAFLVTSAFSQKYFLAAFAERLHDALDREGIDLVLKAPDREYDASSLSHHLNRLLERRRDYLGGVVLAAELSQLRGDLVTFCRKSRLPVVFTDVEPFPDESAYPENTAFVGYDTGALGELAGRWLVAHLRGESRPHVLVVASREHDARQRRCEQVLRLGLPDVSVTVDDSCGFSRSRAHRAVRAHIAGLPAGQRLHAIFCTNDEMALGAVDALSPATPGTRGTVVVGVDGVAEVRALIDSGTGPLRATVVQDADRMAGCIVDVLAKMHRGHRVDRRRVLDAEVYEAVGVTGT
jgi:ribose transport system substrate-binding protein